MKSKNKNKQSPDCYNTVPLPPKKCVRNDSPRTKIESEVRIGSKLHAFSSEAYWPK